MGEGWGGGLRHYCTTDSAVHPERPDGSHSDKLSVSGWLRTVRGIPTLTGPSRPTVWPPLPTRGEGWGEGSAAEGGEGSPLPR